MILALFTIIWLPETRDRTLEEIHEMFEAKLPARKFKEYVCVGVEEMAAQGRKIGGVLGEEKETGVGTEHIEVGDERADKKLSA